MRILVVEDDLELRRLLSVQLGLAGHEVHVAEDGVRALEAVEREDPELLVLDVMMPRLDGWQVLEALRAQPRYETLPVLMLTARSTQEDAERSYTLGASFVMRKPYDGEQLLAAIEALCVPLRR
jgi:DNA-binding response OmpR family regulator